LSGIYSAERLHGRRVVLDRLDRDGAALAALLIARGARVTIADPEPSCDPPAGCVVVHDRAGAVARADLLLVDCWTGETAPHVVLARERAIPVGSLADLVVHEAPCAVIGVTGSAGKTMTTRLIAHLLGALGVEVHLPPVGRAENAWPNADTLALLAGGPVPELFVLELTSTHLAYMSTSPRHAVVTALWPDHIELHGGEGRYIAAKQKIFARQRVGDTAVLPAREQRIAPKPGVAAVQFCGDAPPERGVGVVGGVVIERFGDGEHVVCDLSRTRIAPHLWGNVAAAVATVRGALGLEGDLADAIETFDLPAWRGESIGVVDGRPVFHDGMAATPAKAAAFLRALPDASAVVIAGGLDDLGQGRVHDSPAERRMLVEVCAEAARVASRIILFGPASARIAPLIAGAGADRVEVGADLHWAVGAAIADLDGADSVVFVPGFPVSLEDRERLPQLLEVAAGDRWQASAP